MMGFGKRLSYAFRCFFSVLSNGEIPAEIAPELVPELTRPAPVFERAPEPETPAPEPTVSVDRAVQMLALLQRDGRLIDFITEDIAPDDLGWLAATAGVVVYEMVTRCDPPPHGPCRAPPEEPP